jgi:hypothetical protein
MQFTRRYSFVNDVSQSHTTTASTLNVSGREKENIERVWDVHIAVASGQREVKRGKVPSSQQKYACSLRQRPGCELEEQQREVREDTYTKMMRAM